MEMKDSTSAFDGEQGRTMRRCGVVIMDFIPSSSRHNEERELFATHAPTRRSLHLR